MMINRIRQLSPSAAAHSGGLGGSRFALIEPSPAEFFGSASPSQLHALAFLHARAAVERTRWQRLLRKIFELDE